MASPFGVHLGAEWLKSPEVICRGVPPVEGTTNICVKPGFKTPDPSTCQLSSVTTVGDSPHFAFAGFAGSLMSHVWSLRTRLAKAIQLPSGDHATPEGAGTPLVITVSWPESI